MEGWIDKAIQKLDILCATSVLQAEDGIPATKNSTRGAAKRLIKMIPLTDVVYHLGLEKDGSVELELRFNGRTIFFTILNSGGINYVDEYNEAKSINGGFNVVTREMIQQIIGGE